MTSESRRDFDPSYVEQELEKIDHALAKKIVVFVTGGAVMALEGLKTGTKDIDIVVETKRTLEMLIKSLKACGYTLLSSEELTKPYAKLSAKVLENSDKFRWDLFLKVVAHKLFLSGNMKKRATQMFSGNQLSVLKLSREDIFLMKGVTDRDRDLDDMFRIALSGIDYKAIYTECTYQSDKTGRVWESAFYDQCVDLEARYGVQIPFLKKLRKVAEDKALSLEIKNSLRGGPLSDLQILSTLDGLKLNDVKVGLKKLEKQGLVARSIDNTYSLVK